jgi:GNAT superfamily N-acetyltransferase
MPIRRAGLSDLDLVAPLFDAYRQFYRRPADPALARRFIRDRLEADDAVIYLAESHGRAEGFVQLYPAWSSTAAVPGRLWLLNDLFVIPEARGRGIGQALLAEAKQLGLATNAVGLFLQTARENHGAQRLYESTGYRLDDHYLVYELDLSGSPPPSP